MSVIERSDPTRDTVVTYDRDQAPEQDLRLAPIITTKDVDIKIEVSSVLSPTQSVVTPTYSAPSPTQSVPSSTLELVNHLLQPRPLLGMLALLVAACSVLFSLAILVASNNKPTDSWSVQPTVYLAVASALANSAMRFAYAQAVVVAWWYLASKGATIRALEDQWNASVSVFHALLPSKGSKSLFVRMATVFVTLMIVDGPLLQKASSVVVATQSEMVKLDFALAPELPFGFSGYFQYNSLSQSRAALTVAQDWMARSPISLPTACRGSCVGEIVGPGLTVTNCSTKTWFVYR